MKVPRKELLRGNNANSLGRMGPKSDEGLHSPVNSSALHKNYQQTHLQIKSGKAAEPYGYENMSEMDGYYQVGQPEDGYYQVKQPDDTYYQIK